MFNKKTNLTLSLLSALTVLTLTPTVAQAHEFACQNSYRVLVCDSGTVFTCSEGADGPQIDCNMSSGTASALCGEASVAPDDDSGSGGVQTGLLDNVDIAARHAMIGIVL